MALLTENNRQYYEGAQGFVADGVLKEFIATFDTDLIWKSASPTSADYALNNFKLYESTTGAPGTYQEVTTGYTVVDNTIRFTVAPVNNKVLVIQLKKLDGGNYGATVADKAYGTVVEDNYGSYSYIKIGDIVNNFLVAYIGAGKLVLDAKRTDVIFHAKRALQEFSYDTLRSKKSQELTVPKNLSVVLPQDYVNYVNIYWVDQTGRQHIIMPTNNLHQSPTELPIQDNKGVPIQDSFDNNIESASSIIDDRWNNNNIKNQTNLLNDPLIAAEFYNDYINMFGYGRQYGLEPQYANANGYFNINNRTSNTR